MTSRFLAAALAVLPACVLADRFDDWDKNKDGLLQKGELPPSARGNFERADTNKDGVISREEDRAFLARRQTGKRRPQGGATAKENPDFRILKNLDYVGDANPRQALDLFLPKALSAKPRPLLVFIHGGGWKGGSKEGGFGRLKPFLDSGKYAGASINYRLTAEEMWPAQIHDCKAAIRWLKAHAKEYGYDGGKLAVWGTSAGGHLVAMLGVSGDVPELEGKLGKHSDQDSTVTCVVNYFGPSNLLTMDDHPSDIKHSAADSPEGKLVGGALAERRKTATEASPVSHVSKPDAPTLIAHGTKDRLVPFAQSVEFSGLLEKAGVPVIFITMEDAGHGFRSAELQSRVGAYLGMHLLGEKAEVSGDAIPMGE